MALAIPQAVTHLLLTGYDPHRVYSEATASAGWRELRDDIWGKRYWSHVSLRITTWSLVEVLRLNGLEEFLLAGDWGLFTAVPEDQSAYEDLSWGLDLYKDDRLSGRPERRLPRGCLVVGIGMSRPDVMEVLVPGGEKAVQTFHTYYRFPLGDGRKYVQRLIAREHASEDDIEAQKFVSMGSFNVLGACGALGGGALVVTAERDPQSDEIGRLEVGMEIRLSVIVGTRAQLAHNQPPGEIDAALCGGWISILCLDAQPTVLRVLVETENQQLAKSLDLEVAKIRELETSGEHDDGATRAGRAPWADQLVLGVATSSVGAYTIAPPQRRKPELEEAEQRPTVAGGWRSMRDEIWNRPVYIAPVSGRVTWGVTEVLRTGGLDDLLLARSWEIGVVDPLALECMKDPSWVLEVYADPGLSGQPILGLPKGRMIVVQFYDVKTGVVSLLLPPSPGSSTAASAYARYRMRDGRLLLRALLAPAEFEGAASFGGGGAEAPTGAILEGPYFAVPLPGESGVKVSVGQDLSSDHWTQFPAGHSVSMFDEVLGFRAQLPQLEGGGWVSLFSTDGLPLFRRRPTPPPVLELPGQVEDGVDARLPVVWPEFGVQWPQKHSQPVVQEEERTLSQLLSRLGGGRAVCDWERKLLLPSNKGIWVSPLTLASTTLDDLLQRNIWKAAVVEAPTLPVREAGDPSSRIISTLPKGALIIAEWVACGNAVRMLLPSEPNCERPQHVWADLGGDSGSALVPLLPGDDYWVEPRGGHLTDEQQEDEDPFMNPATVPVREQYDDKSPILGCFQRGDAVQLAEIKGRCARVLLIAAVVVHVGCPQTAGWIDVFDDAGWSILKRRYPGEVHVEERRRESLKELPEEEERASEPLPEGPVRPAELPPLLWKLGEMEVASMHTKDWREEMDPVWGRLYFVNKYSGQIIHRLETMGVACATVRLTLWFSNLSLTTLREAEGDEADAQQADLESGIVHALAALADVPQDMLQAHFAEGTDGAEIEQGTSIGDGSLVAKEAWDREFELSFRVVAEIRAPGARIAWASAALKELMADSERFALEVVTLISSVPKIFKLRVAPVHPVNLRRAMLEELDINRTAPCLLPLPAPEGPPPPPVDEDIAEISRQMPYNRPAVLQMPNRNLGEPTGNMQALGDGLRLAAASPSKPHLEEIGLWKCSLGDLGAVALAGVIASGCCGKLQTLLLDENGIAAAGATALGKGLASCTELRELGIARNPLGVGFLAIVGGLGAALVVFDASDSLLSDGAAMVTAAALPRWPALRSLRFNGNKGIGLTGAEALARALPGAPSLKLADLKGCAASSEQAGISRLLEAAGVDPSRMRL